VSAPRLIVVTVAVATASVGAGACAGQGAGGGAIARVGQAAITAETLTHWITVLAPGHHVGARHQALEQRALGFLISAQWLIGEAARDGVGVSDAEVQGRLREKANALAGGDGGLAQALAAAGQTIADASLEIRAELAAAKLRQMLRRSEPAVTTAEASRYYLRNVQRFAHNERREFYIVEDLGSLAIARQRFAEIKHGRNIALSSIRESEERSPHPLSAPSIVKAIFTSRPGELMGPVAVNSQLYYLIQVISITPAAVQSFAAASPAIEAQLQRERRRRTLAAFVRSWTARWTARTDCRPGYVAPGCRQYAGTKAPENPLGAE